MANIKTTDPQWEQAKLMFESGKLLREISEEMGASIPSLSKRIKRDKWLRKRGYAQELAVSDSADAVDENIKKQVEAMASFGLTDEEIAEIVGISVEALRKSFKYELSTAPPRMVAKVAQSLYQMATDINRPNAAAAMFWLKCRGGWKDSATQAGGKKEERQEAAKNAVAGKFKQGMPPKLVVSNK